MNYRCVRCVSGGGSTCEGVVVGVCVLGVSGGGVCVRESGGGGVMVCVCGCVVV